MFYNCISRTGLHQLQNNALYNYFSRTGLHELQNNAQFFQNELLASVI